MPENKTTHKNQEQTTGILLVDKPKGKTSFSLVRALRKILGVKKIGHTGTLDPFATGVMVLLIGKKFTRQSDNFLSQDKEYSTTLMLGVSTDTYDCDGQITKQSDLIPNQDEIDKAIQSFQGTIEQIPPMFSAKKVNGKKLYELARQGKEIERKAATVQIETTIIDYTYPHLKLKIKCSKGTYIRSVAHDLGEQLGCGAHLIQLERIRSGQFHIDDCVNGELLFDSSTDHEKLQPWINR